MNPRQKTECKTLNEKKQKYIIKLKWRQMYE